ncbi:putative nucleic acid-binding protein [Lewinella antarctica]|uniref:Nucleic acid-binding protein n=1 Tax=Neolewinella antarctica TaxID=442734 RepID=A0ABX0X9K2_9BACT|nr:putative nucleic acid-binding protein [Neolewinella antarctica]
MALTHLWDTNIVIYVINGSLPVKIKKILQRYTHPASIAISIISEIEVRGFKNGTQQENLIAENYVTNVTQIISPHKHKSTKMWCIATPKRHLLILLCLCVYVA